MQREEAGCRIKRAFGRVINITFDQVGAARIVAHGFACEVEHWPGWIDTRKAPASLRLGQCPQFQAATRTEDQYMSIRRRMLG